MMKTYNKLVRDKVPQIIQASGQQCDARVLDEQEYDLALKTKMQEELNEFFEADSQGQQIEELADLLEVIYSFSQSKEIGKDELERIRQNKYYERGGFQERLMLLSTYSNDGGESIEGSEGHCTVNTYDVKYWV
jgi:predicted house-cleaning noncanonical NTP pyrophosphatase (MazG superfamily)